MYLLRLTNIVKYDIITPPDGKAKVKREERWRTEMKKYLNNFMKYRFLLQELVKKDIKLKYRRSVLGLVWTLLEPLLNMLVLWVVFSKLYAKDDALFPVYILTGRLMTQFFSGATKSAMKSIRTNSGMIKKVYVPKYIYPLSSVLSNFVTFLLSLIVLVGVAAVLHVKPTIYVFGAIVPIVLLLIMSLGFGLILATLAVFFRDLEYLWGVFLTLLFYACAVFYYPSRVIKNGFEWIFKVNPLYCLIQNFRNTVMYGQGFDMYALVFSAVVSFGSLIIGVYVFYKNQDKFILNI